MAVDMFIKIGDLEGESKDKAHAKEIDVLAWSWGMSNSGSAQSGTGAGSGKVNVQDISITKWLDKSSTNLMMACCQGTHYDTATLTVRKAGKVPLEYLVITMKKVIVTSVSGGGSGGEDRLTENVSLNFASFDAAYKPQKDDGTGEAAVHAKYNMAENAAE